MRCGADFLESGEGGDEVLCRNSPKTARFMQVSHFAYVETVFVRHFAKRLPGVLIFSVSLVSRHFLKSETPFQGYLPGICIKVSRDFSFSYYFFREENKK